MQLLYARKKKMCLLQDPLLPMYFFWESWQAISTISTISTICTICFTNIRAYKACIT